MARESFDAALEALRSDVRALGETVLDRLLTAVEALETRDAETARYVLEHDDDINERYLALEADCIDLFALQQPVASDLRTVAAAFKILTDLERVGDLAANLGGYVLSMDQDLIRRQNLVDIGRLVADLLGDVLDAYAAADADQCRQLVDRDQEIDGLCERAAALLIRDLVGYDPGNADRESVLSEAHRLLLTIRDLERIGDHAVNIAARTYYEETMDDSLLE